MTCSETQGILHLYEDYFIISQLKDFPDGLTRVGTLHEVPACIFWVTIANLTGYWVEPGEVGSMETVVVLLPA